MKFFPAMLLKRKVKLTEEREKHIADGHPDLLPAHLPKIVETLADPDEIRSLPPGDSWEQPHKSVNRGTAVYSRQYSDLTGGMVVVMVVLDLFDPPWIVTAYITQDPPTGDMEYERNS